MKNSSSISWNIIRSCLSIVLGFVMIVWHQAIIKYFVVVLGAAFLVLGIISIIAYYMKRENSKELKFPISAIIYLVLGLLFVIIPHTLTNVIIILMGLLLMLAAVDQIYLLINASKIGFHISYLRYIIPILIFIAGIVIALNPEKIATASMIIFGTGLMLYGITNIYNQYSLKSKKEKIE